MCLPTINETTVLPNSSHKLQACNHRNTQAILLSWQASNPAPHRQPSASTQCVHDRMGVAICWLPEHILETALIIVESHPALSFDGPNSPPQSDRAILTLVRGPVCKLSESRPSTYPCENRAMQQFFTFFQKTWAKIGPNGACNNRQEEGMHLLCMNKVH